MDEDPTRAEGAPLAKGDPWQGAASPRIVPVPNPLLERGRAARELLAATFGDRAYMKLVGKGVGGAVVISRVSRLVPSIAPSATFLFGVWFGLECAAYIAEGKKPHADAIDAAHVEVAPGRFLTIAEAMRGANVPLDIIDAHRPDEPVTTDE